MRDAGCGMRDAGCGMRDAGLKKLSLNQLLVKYYLLFFSITYSVSGIPYHTSRISYLVSRITYLVSGIPDRVSRISYHISRIPNHYLVTHINPYGGFLLIHHEDFLVRAYEVDAKGKASVPTICNYLQEAAGNHATKLGVAVDHLFKLNMTWVLSRLHVQFSRFPYWREKIHLETWPSGKKGKYATRDFLIFDQNKNIIVRGTSSWMILDLKTLKPLSMPDFMKDIESPDRIRAIEDQFLKLSVPDNPDIEKKYDVRLNDLDINQHVNNVKYIEWALESIPITDWRKNQLTDLEISYRAETKYGERVIVKTQKNEDKYLHHIVADEDKRSLAVLKTNWKAKVRGKEIDE